MSAGTNKLTAIQSQAVLRLCYGVFVPVSGPCALDFFLEQGLGLSPDYMRERVQTILLNGLAVDSGTAKLYPGARLALSAAMPGVVGATLRKGGHYAAMRQGITHKESPTTAHCAGGPFWLELRCFNDIAREQALPLLARGYLCPGDGLTPALHALATALPPGLPTNIPPCLPSSAPQWILFSGVQS